MRQFEPFRDWVHDQLRYLSSVFFHTASGAPHEQFAGAHDGASAPLHASSGRDLRQQTAALASEQRGLRSKQAVLETSADNLQVMLQKLEASLDGLATYYKTEVTRQAAVRSAMTPAAYHASLQPLVAQERAAASPRTGTTSPATPSHTGLDSNAGVSAWTGKTRSIDVYLCQDMASSIEPILPLLQNTLSFSRGRSFTVTPIPMTSTMPWARTADGAKSQDRPQQPTCLIFAYFVSGSRWLDKLKSEGFARLQARTWRAPLRERP